MRKNIKKIEDRINIFLKDHIKGLKVTEADFASFTNEFSALRSLGHAISDKEAQSRVIKSIDEQLELVSAQIDTKSSQ